MLRNLKNVNMFLKNTMGTVFLFCHIFNVSEGKG